MKVTQLAVDPYRHDAAVVTEQVEPGRGRVGHALLPGVVRGYGDRHAGHVRFLPERGSGAAAGASSKGRRNRALARSLKRSRRDGEIWKMRRLSRSADRQWK